MDIITACGQCCFAEYTETTQTGCQLGRLTKFAKLGKTRPTNDGQRTSFNIEGICNTCRKPEWAAMYENPAKKVMEQLSDQYSVIVMYGEGFNKTLKSVLNQTLKPRNIIITAREKDIHSFKELFDSIKTICGEYTKFDLIKVFGETAKEECLDIAAKKVKGAYYSVFESGFLVPPNFLETLNNILNYKLEKMLLLMPLGGNGLTVQNNLHKLVFGNVKMPVQDKVIELAKEQHTEYLIRKYSDIFEVSNAAA